MCLDWLGIDTGGSAPTPARPVDNANPNTTPKATVKTSTDTGVSTGTSARVKKSKTVPGLGL